MDQTCEKGYSHTCQKQTVANQVWMLNAQQMKEMPG
jgi:hypothetical protein